VLVAQQCVLVGTRGIAPRRDSRPRYVLTVWFGTIPWVRVEPRPQLLLGAAPFAISFCNQQLAVYSSSLVPEPAAPARRALCGVPPRRASASVSRGRTGSHGGVRIEPRQNCTLCLRTERRFSAIRPVARTSRTMFGPGWRHDRPTAASQHLYEPRAGRVGYRSCRPAHGAGRVRILGGEFATRASSSSARLRRRPREATPRPGRRSSRSCASGIVARRSATEISPPLSISKTRHREGSEPSERAPLECDVRWKGRRRVG